MHTTESTSSLQKPGDLPIDLTGRRVDNDQAIEIHPYCLLRGIGKSARGQLGVNRLKLAYKIDRTKCVFELGASAQRDAVAE